MKTKLTLAIAFLILFNLQIIAAAANPTTYKQVRLNQLGYYPSSLKYFVVASGSAFSFDIKDTSNKTVFSGKLLDHGKWKQSGEHIKSGDFTALQTPGTYRIHLNHKENPVVSYPFEIKPHVYSSALKAAVKSYYFQRASMELEEKYAGKWKRPMGHPDDKCRFHPSSGHSGGTLNSPGGWYDAGDYNKYIVNAGLTISMLLSFYELYPGIVKDNSLNIPESGNGLSDLLDEIKYELDWVLTMQDSDGGVFFKLTTKAFKGFNMPHEDKDTRYIVGKSTASALNFAAMTAQAARVFRPIDREYAAKCLRASQRAWQWSIKNKQIYFTNPGDISTGEYGDNDLSHEFFWAASQLLVSTGKTQYSPYIYSHFKFIKNEKSESWRTFVDELGCFALATVDTPTLAVPGKLKKEAIQVILRQADDLLEEISHSPYRIPVSLFLWGSNGDMADDAVLLSYAYRFTKNKKYLNAIVGTVDYLFGKNATGYCFLTGYGTNPPMNLHHRPSGADGIKDPVPGFLVGGPNQTRQDLLTPEAPYGVTYPFKEPARVYVDKTGSFASNEVCLNWNAPLIFILGFLESLQL